MSVEIKIDLLSHQITILIQFEHQLNNFTMNVFEDCCDGTQQMQFSRGLAGEPQPPFVDLTDTALDDIQNDGGCTGVAGYGAPMEPRLPAVRCSKSTPEECALAENIGVPPYTLNLASGPDQLLILPMAVNWPEDEAVSQTLRFTVPPIAGAVLFKPTKIALAFDGLRFGHAQQLRWSITSPSTATATAMQSGPPCTLATSFGSQGFLVARATDCSNPIDTAVSVGVTAVCTDYAWQTEELKNNKWGADYKWTSHGAPVVSNSECPSTAFGCVSCVFMSCCSLLFTPRPTADRVTCTSLHSCVVRLLPVLPAHCPPPPPLARRPRAPQSCDAT